jgi:hypothetical protein
MQRQCSREAPSVSGPLQKRTASTSESNGMDSASHQVDFCRCLRSHGTESRDQTKAVAEAEAEAEAEIEAQAQAQIEQRAESRAQSYHGRYRSGDWKCMT